MPGIPVQWISGYLAVNDGPLGLGNVNLLRPSDPNKPLDELRKRYNEDGMLLLKGLLPREDMLQAQ
jgi:phytanoyl-CoA hydroxylase